MLRPLFEERTRTSYTDLSSPEAALSGDDSVYDLPGDRLDRTFLLLASVLGFLGVALGAFGAHALRSRLSPEMLVVFETAVRYQMYHVFALLIVSAAIGHLGSARLLVMAGWSFFAGILIFSGSLYGLALTGTRALGAITPLGGLAFLIGWAFLALFAAAR